MIKYLRSGLRYPEPWAAEAVQIVQPNRPGIHRMLVWYSHILQGNIVMPSILKRSYLISQSNACLLIVSEKYLWFISCR